MKNGKKSQQSKVANKKYSVGSLKMYRTKPVEERADIPRPLTKTSEIFDKLPESGIDKNLNRYLRIMRCQTPSLGSKMKDSSVQTHFKRVKDVCK